MHHKQAETPAYVLWVESRPSTKAKGKEAYVRAIQDAAKAEIAEPIHTDDVEVEIVYSTTAKEPPDVDNAGKPTLDR